MSAAEAVAAVLFLAVIAYSVFGGADFGSGVWDLTAGRNERGAPTRRLVDHAIGPVWEANHVWLIFVLVLLWSGFPGPFTSLVQAVAVPLWLAGLGIVARGAAFAFRKYAPTMRWAKATGIVFASSSLLTPALLGAIAGAVASGRVPADGDAGPWSAWTGPTSVLGAVLAVATCTFLAGVFLAAEAETLGDVELTDELRRKSLVGGAVTGAIVLAGVPVLIVDAETLVDGLLGRALALVIVSAVAGAAALWLLWRERVRPARVAATVAVAAVVAGWGVGQYPWLLVDEVEIAEGAGASATLIGTLIASGVALALVLPSLAYLYSLADTNKVGTEDQPLSPATQAVDFSSHEDQN